MGLPMLLFLPVGIGRGRGLVSGVCYGLCGWSCPVSVAIRSVPVGGGLCWGVWPWRGFWGPVMAAGPCVSGAVRARSRVLVSLRFFVGFWCPCRCCRIDLFGLLLHPAAVPVASWRGCDRVL